MKTSQSETAGRKTHECLKREAEPAPTVWNQPVEQPVLVIVLVVVMLAVLTLVRAWFGL